MPLWTYPEGHEPEWLDWSAHSGADRDPQLRAMELQAERDNVLAEVWFLRVLCLVLGVALVWAL